MVNRKMTESILLAPVKAVHQPHHGVKNNANLIRYDRKPGLSPNQTIRNIDLHLILSMMDFSLCVGVCCSL